MNIEALNYIKKQLAETADDFYKWLFSHPDLIEEKDIKMRDKYVAKIKYYLHKGRGIDLYFLDDDKLLAFSRLCKTVVTKVRPYTNDEFEYWEHAHGDKLYFYYYK